MERDPFAPRSRRRLVLGAAGALAAGLLVVGIVTGGGDPNGRGEDGQVAGPTTVGLDDLRPGDCVADTGHDGSDYLPALPCSQPHEGEVFARLELKRDDYVGDEFLTAAASKQCEVRLAAYSPGSDYALSFFYPAAAGFAYGDRTVICVLEHPDGDLLVGSARSPDRA